MNKRISLSIFAVAYLLVSVAIKNMETAYGFQLYRMDTPWEFIRDNFIFMIAYGPFNFLVIAWDSYLKSIIFFILFAGTSAVTFYPLTKPKKDVEHDRFKKLLIILLLWFSAGFILSATCAGLNILGMMGNIGA